MVPITIGIVDDHMVVRDGIGALAERSPDLTFWGAAESAEELHSLLGRSSPDVLLVDVRLGSEDGFELCRTVHERYPQVRLLVFTAFGDAELLRAGLEAGAAGYVLKDISTRTLPAVIRQVHEQGFYFDARLASEVVLSLAKGDIRRDPGFVPTDREAAILRLIAEGKTNREIASALSISPHTVKFYVGKMLRELGVSRRAELVKAVYERHLLA